MAHELETFQDGRTAFVSARKDAWHRLGTVLPRDLTAEEVMTHGMLGDWNVRKQEVTVPIMSDTGVTMTTVPGQFAMLRTNPATKQEELIGGGAIVGSIYRPFQNEQLTAFLQALVDESGAIFDTAGSMRNGADVFVTMKLPKTMMVGGIDALDLNIAVLNNHVGSAAIRGLITPTRIDCANTQRAALRNAQGSFKIRHTENAGQRVIEAREKLDLTFKYLDEFQAEADRMINERLTADEFDKITAGLWEPLAPGASPRSATIERNRKGQLRSLFTTAGTNEQIRNTRWGGYQAITEYLDHFAPVQGKTELEKAVNRAVRSADTGNDAVKTKAFAAFAVSR